MSPLTRLKLALATGAVAASAQYGIPLLIDAEGFEPKPYYDSARVLTDCYGETQGVKLGVNRDEKTCRNILNSRYHEFGEFVIARIEQPISAKTLASFISFTYNVGKGAFASSTLLREYNAGRFYAACEQMKRWIYITKAGVKIPLPGLANRRKKENALCHEGLKP